MNYCPRCGYHLADAEPSIDEAVKRLPEPANMADSLTESFDPARWALSEPVKGDERIELRDAKQPLSAALTRNKVKEVRKLYEKGHALARIRDELNLNVTITRLQTIVNKPW